MKIVPILSSYAKAAVDLADKCSQTSNVEEYERLDRHVRRLEGMAREAFQEEFKAQYEAIAGHLEEGKPLTEEEKRALELLIVGEARYYVQDEANFEAWQRELQQLTQEIKTLESQGLDQADTLLRLQALCKDLRGILPDMTMYLRERDRIQSFQRSVQTSFDPETARVLAEVVRAMLRSEEM